MPLIKKLAAKKIALLIKIILPATSFLFFNGVFAASGPILKNVNPQGLVTSGSPTITLDTEDLARCRYSTSDTGYENMGNTMTSPDGLDHSAPLGSLAKGSYTYYVRCKDFQDIANDTSAVVKFNVGDVGCVGDNCGTTPPPNNQTGSGPTLSNPLPTGKVLTSSVTLSIKTSEPADCRYSWYDKAYEAMTLSFTSSDRLAHNAAATLWNYGYYTYYVRCKNDAGNVNQIAGKISFRYATNYVAPENPPVSNTPPADKTAPVILSVAPLGEVNTATVSLTCNTDEAAVCRYGKTDGDYDTLTDVMDTSGGLAHSKSVTFEAPGNYVYYVRCKDVKGNKNNTSSQIAFDYKAAVKPGPEISGLQPSGGTVLQKNISLTVTTDKPADCRYSENDVEFDSMGENFNTNDGELHQAIVTLEELGNYAYYVRCKDKEGNANDKSEVINFEYKGMEEETAPEETSPKENPQNGEEPVSCSETKMGESKDGGCDKANDCICDPDCPASGSDADPDCANLTVVQPNNSWIAVVLIGLLLLVIVIIIIIIIKRKGSGGEEEVELP